MNEIFTMTLGNVVKILIFIALGYGLRNLKGFPKESGATLSMLAAWVLSPAYNIRSLARDFTLETLSQKLLILGWGVVFLGVTMALGFFASRLCSKDKDKRRVLLYAFSFSNYGYFGYPLVESVFGPEILADFIVFSQPLNFATATFGYWLLTQRKDFSFKRFVVTPVVWSPFLGAALGLLSLRPTGFLEDTLSALSTAMSPVVMILMGFVLGRVPLKKLFCNLGPYGISLVRLVVIALVGGGLYWVTGLGGVWFLLPVLILAMPIGSNIIVYPESCGIDTTDNAKAVFISYVLAVGLLPVTFTAISYMAGL